MWLEPYFNTVEIGRLCEYLFANANEMKAEGRTLTHMGDVAGTPVAVKLSLEHPMSLMIIGRDWTVGMRLCKDRAGFRSWEVANDNVGEWPPVYFSGEAWKILSGPTQYGNKDQFEKDLVLLRLFSDLWLEVET